MTIVLTVLLWILAVVLIVIGLAGLVLPVLPGPLILFVGLVLAAWAEGFVYVGKFTITLLAVIMVVAFALDYLAAAFGVKRFGASKQASMGAIIGATVGMFMGVPGLLLGPFVGAFLGELVAQNKLDAAGRAGLGAWVGFLLGTVAKIALGFSMLGAFLVARFL